MEWAKLIAIVEYQNKCPFEWYKVYHIYLQQFSKNIRNHQSERTINIFAVIRCCWLSFYGS